MKNKKAAGDDDDHNDNVLGNVLKTCWDKMVSK